MPENNRQYFRKKKQQIIPFIQEEERKKFSSKFANLRSTLELLELIIEIEIKEWFLVILHNTAIR